MTQTVDPRELEAPPIAPSIADPYDPQVNAENFDMDRWLARIDPRWLQHPETRREMCKYDPLLFAIVYLAHHLKTDERVTFADCHFQWARHARTWAGPAPGLMADRHVYVAPRDTGKSTWWFLILPMWAAAYGHRRFAAAFAHSGTQAEMHLHAFRQELGQNVNLRRDFPGLCTPSRKPNGKTTADNIQMWRGRGGFAYAARGIDAANLGLKEGDTRPDLIILDDVEPDEASYSVYQMGKRRGTLIEAILPMNLRASVVLVGTVTMPGSVIHQCVLAAAGTDDPQEWIGQERFTVHHALPIVHRDDGTERSIWPAKWPIGFLQKIRHTRTYAKNFANDPMGNDGGYWSKDDFTYEQLDGATAQYLSIDPTITTGTKSDPAGVAIVSYYPPRVLPADLEAGRRRPVRLPSRCSVDECWEVRLVGEPLRLFILRKLQAHPDIRMVIVEGNQGGENWHAILHDLPPGVRLRLVWSTSPKEVRAADLLSFYQSYPPRVVHSKRLPALEQQMVSYPNGHDDMIDGVGAVVLRLFGPRVQKATTIMQR